MAKNTCDIITNSNAQTQRVIDYLTNGVNEAMEKAAEGVHE